mmetsp:Transcript_39244/g.88207  ORF Transcript_39244/g.88207 Transcript_39244/m.88207 type:complete len:211 (-) Transcript_39244:1881-2513(-)
MIIPPDSMRRHSSSTFSLTTTPGPGTSGAALAFAAAFLWACASRRRRAITMAFCAVTAMRAVSAAFGFSLPSGFIFSLLSMTANFCGLHQTVALFSSSHTSQRPSPSSKSTISPIAPLSSTCCVMPWMRTRAPTTNRRGVSDCLSTALASPLASAPGCGSALGAACAFLNNSFLMPEDLGGGAEPTSSPPPPPPRPPAPRSPQSAPPQLR